MQNKSALSPFSHPCISWVYFKKVHMCLQEYRYRFFFFALLQYGFILYSYFFVTCFLHLLVYLGQLVVQIYPILFIIVQYFKVEMYHHLFNSISWWTFRLSLIAIGSSFAVGILIYILVKLLGMSIRYFDRCILLSCQNFVCLYTYFHQEQVSIQPYILDFIGKVTCYLRYFSWVEFKFSPFPIKFHRVDLQLRFVGFKRLGMQP